LSTSTENGTNGVLTTRIKSPAQVFFCRGCCCGRTDRGLPDVPVDRIKSAWKAEKLNRGVQLTISGCLGPCDHPNVALVLTAEGAQWFGRIEGDARYEAIIDWARACVAAGSTLPLPEILEAHRLQRFGGAE
jgi:cobaltochelatase CobN